MCDMNLCRDLENGKGNDLRTQSLGISKTMQLVDAIGKRLDGVVKTLGNIQSRLADIPDRTEVREITKESLSIHADSCAKGRKTASPQQVQPPAIPQEENKVELAVGKFLGFKASGRLGMVLWAAVWIAVGIVICVAIFHANELSVFCPKGTTP